MMYNDLIPQLRELASIPAHCENVESCDGCSKENICLSFTNERIIEIASKAADAIEELQKAVMRLEDESGILDELPMVDQSTPCDTCVHKGNVDFDYCHICNNEANMYKPKPPKEE